jgi:hypothetical protein
MTLAVPLRRRPPLRAILIETTLAVAGAGLVVAAFCADQAWFDAHFLPVFFLTRDRYVFGETCARTAMVAIGLAMALFLRPAAGRLVAGLSLASLAAVVARAAIAVLLAAGVGELGLRWAHPGPQEQPLPTKEPLCRPDARLGWTFVPGRVGRVVVAGRPIDYVLDARGYRVADLAHPVDTTRPTLIFVGESIITGFGLHWNESIPALVGAALHTQSANLSVFAYADDQTYQRLASELPRFDHPKAVVILFSPGLVFRDFDDERPHLASDGVWRPPVRRSHLERLVRFFVPYHSREEIDRQIALVRGELAADIRMARARQAQALIVVPHFGPEDATERILRRRILDEPGLPYVWVNLDPALRIPHDPHPNPRGARAIAAAIVDRLSPPT